MYALVLIAALLGAVCADVTSNRRIEQMGESCQTPNNTAGTCKAITDCQVILELLHLPVDKRPVQYLRGILCVSYLSRTPVVCCPDAVEETTDDEVSKTTVTNPDHRKRHLINREGCGRSYIVGSDLGKEARNQFPWMAVLSSKRGNTTRDECAGSLITDKYVLTAAHCINSKLTQIRLGEHDLRTDPDCVTTFKGETCADPVQNFTIKRTVKHPQYSAKTFVNDIALIELDRPANLTDFVHAICLPIEGSNVEGKNCTVAGWAYSKYNTTGPVLLKDTVTVISLTDCQALFLSKGARLTLSDGHICAGGSGLTDMCSGVSGGPLKWLNGDSNFVQYGILSHGARRCTSPGLPSVYTAVSKYIPWILDNITP